MENMGTYRQRIVYAPWGEIYPIPSRKAKSLCNPKHTTTQARNLGSR